MPATRCMPPYWRRSAPRANCDIAKLKPATRPSGERFETLADAREESIRSEAVLTAYRTDNGFSTCLQECREGDYDCEQTYCPRCARNFRRHITGELLRLNSEAGDRPLILVVLLQQATRGQILALDIQRYRQSLRKKLDRAGLGEVPVVGGFEMVYQAGPKQWVLHVNLVLFGGKKKAIRRFKDGFPDVRSVRQDELTDPVKQLSYVLKFTTYHRPYEQRGVKKSKAVPLNPSEHFELVEWMAQYEFTDHLFLFNARRRGSSIELSIKVARNA
jgi:hypothetical protein